MDKLINLLKNVKKIYTWNEENYKGRFGKKVI